MAVRSEYEAGWWMGCTSRYPPDPLPSQLHERVNKFISNLFPADHKPEPVLAVPGYLRAGDFTGNHLGQYEVWWEDHAGHDAHRKFWAAESSKRFLASQIAVGTVDQAMMGALKVRHGHMRAACLARNLLVVDEVHASDTYMRAIIEALLDAHTAGGGYALLMSATLGSGGAAHPAVPRPAEDSRRPAHARRGRGHPLPGHVTGGPMGEVVTGSRVAPAARTSPYTHLRHARLRGRARRMLAAARDGAMVLVIRNTVNFAIETQQALLEEADAGDRALLFACRGFPTLHHGRFAAEDRKLLDAAVEGQVGRHRDEGGRVVVGTQTLEQSLDIDADLLITDLCPVDVLLSASGVSIATTARGTPPRLRDRRLRGTDPGW